MRDKMREGIIIYLYTMTIVLLIVSGVNVLFMLLLLSIILPTLLFLDGKISYFKGRIDELCEVKLK
jgi:TM2 domain-containing membrane protein YozV